MTSMNRLPSFAFCGVTYLPNWFNTRHLSDAQFYSKSCFYLIFLFRMTTIFSMCLPWFTMKRNEFFFQGIRRLKHTLIFMLSTPNWTTCSCRNAFWCCKTVFSIDFSPFSKSEWRINHVAFLMNASDSTPVLTPCAVFFLTLIFVQIETNLSKF